MVRRSTKSQPMSGRDKMLHRRLIIKRILIGFLAVLLVATGSAFAYVKYIEGKMQPKGKLAGAVAAVLSEPAPQEPVNFLVLGCDRTEEDSGRSDTIMVLRVDLNKNKAVMISIPRDFRVEIPDHGTDKINHSFNYGGPALTIKAVEKLTGLSINHYVVVDYNGFIGIVDTIGGVDINVDERMVDDELGDPIEAGPQKMDGVTALHYVRWRNDPRGDFARIDHQQKFARALIDQSSSLLNAFKIPQLVNIVSSSVETDMTMADMLSYAGHTKSVNQNNLTTITLPGAPGDVDGVSYVMPDWDKVELIMDLVRNDKPLDEAIAMEIQPYDITAKVLNGSATEGAAGEVADFLSNKGYQIVSVGNADRNDYAKSVLFYAKANYGKALNLKSALKEVLPDIEVKESNTLDSQDVLLIVGSDYKK